MWGVDKLMLPVAEIVADAADEFGVLAVITSAREGIHSENSRHYYGLALDFRTRDLPQGMKSAFADRVRELIEERLGQRQYDVVLEQSHLHVEHDPKH